MEGERLDLSALDLAADVAGHERLVRRVMGAAAPELARRSRATAPLAMLAGWARPVLAAAAAIAVLASGAMLVTELTGDDLRMAAPAEPAAMIEDLGVPSPAAEWLAERREPTEADLVLALERRR